MNTCLDCAWYRLCEPEDIHCACSNFARPEDLQWEMGHILYQDWCRCKEMAAQEEENRKEQE